MAAERMKAFCQRGFSLLEVLIVVALLAILGGIAVSNLKAQESPLASASSHLTHFLRLVRANAIAQTKSMTVTPTSRNHLAISSSHNCTEEDKTPVSDLSLDIIDEVQLSTTDWSLCFTQRGLAQAYVTFNMQSGSNYKTVEVALGGGVRIQ